MLKKRREAYRESLREDILDAARQLFVVHGFEQTSIRSIATKVGASPGILYHYFEDKQDIMAFLVRETFSKLSERLSAISLDHDSPSARLKRILRSYIEFGLEHPHHYALLFMKPGNLEENEKIQAAFREEGHRTFDCLRSVCQESIDAHSLRKEISDANELGQCLWISIHGLVSTQIALKNFPWVERSRLADRLLDILMSGILKT